MLKTNTIIAICGLFAGLVGCNDPNFRMAPRRPTINLAPAAVAAGPDGASDNAAAGARDWKDKYSRRTEECLKLQRQNVQLEDTNRKLVAEVAKLKDENAKAGKELSDANKMLGVLNKDLGRWKRDVLGFRQEMRRAQKAQFDLMKRMVVLLGGEVPTVPEGATEKLANKE